MLAPRARAAPDRLLAQDPPATVVVVERLADREIAGRADIATAQAAGEEPVRGPAAETAERRELLDDERRLSRADRLEVQRAGDDRAREIADVLRLPRRVLQRSELPYAYHREPRGLRERPHRLAADRHRRPESTDEPRAAGERERKVDLLSRARSDEHLERRGRERGTQSVERLDERGQRRVGLRHPIERDEIEFETEKAAHFPDDRSADGGVRARQPNRDPRVVHGPAPPHLVRDGRAPWSEHARANVPRDAVRLICYAVVAESDT